MIPIPAIDVLDGRVVRLHQGSFAAVTEFGPDPVRLAAEYAAAGAERLHLVDLAGARHGRLDVELVAAVAAVASGLQVGGGVRTTEDAQAVLAAGAGRVVVGSMAVHRPGAVVELVGAVGGAAVVVAIDVRAGRARGSAWADDGAGYERVVEAVVAAGVGSLLVTGIDRDGTLTGPDLDLVRAVRIVAPDIEIIASGGVADLADLDRAAEAGADAAVIGRALLEGRFTLADAIAHCND